MAACPPGLKLPKEKDLNQYTPHAYGLLVPRVPVSVSRLLGGNFDAVH